MSELITPYQIANMPKMRWIPCDVVDKNGVHAMTCFPDDADETLKRINGYKQLEAQIDELQRAFDLQWEASRRAIKMWQAETGKELEWPDKADLCLWLMQRNDDLQATNKELLEALEQAKTQIDLLHIAISSNDPRKELVARVVDIANTTTNAKQREK